MAAAAQLQNSNQKTVAIIGDGAMTAGLAFEGLNHGGGIGSDMLVVLNDNCMSIDPNVGALKEYLTDISTSHTYNKVKDEVWHILGKFSRFGPTARDVIARVENAIKSSLLKHSNYFESLNWRYFGPVDGHDVNHLVKVLQDLKDIPGPKILHTLTQKGKGYKPAEEGSATLWHAPGLFNKDTGEIIKVVPKSAKPPKFQDVFGYSIIELAEKNEKIVGITPAMPSGCSLKFMMEAMPDRAFDVGIAEQHAVTFSAGLAAGGMVPFCNIYSSFMQRAYDSVIHDVAIQNLHVVFCLDRGGLVGADGPTHHGGYDIAFFRCIPNMIISAPLHEEDLRNLMYSAQLPEYAGPWSIRYPRGEGSMTDWKRPFKAIKPGTGMRLRNGDDIAVLSFGAIGTEAIKACESLESKGVSAAHYDLRFAKPLDEMMLHEVFGKFSHVITLEDGCIMGGIGSAVLEFMADHGYRSKVVRLGIPDRIVEHGNQAELYRECNYDAQAVEETALSMLSGKQKASIAG
jgi:1-deoxy-D-xylulose-5-phosphate synthase